VAELTIADLTRILRECAGADEDVDLDGDILEMTFEDLGYDSLALLNTAGRIERDLSIKLPDETVAEAKTPRALLATVNELARQTA
jgi:minimal PKS acyl carrier protein